MSRWIGGSGGRATIDLVDTLPSATVSGSTYSWTGVNFGVASAGRVIAIPVAHTGNVNISSATIGGISATVFVVLGATVAIVYCAVPTGTSGAVTVTATGVASGQKAIGSVFRIGRVISPTPVTGTPALVTGTTAATPSVNVKNAGVAIAVVAGPSSFTSTWSGDFTEATDASVTAAITASLTTAILAAPSALSPATGTQTPSVSSARFAGAIAWR